MSGTALATLARRAAVLADPLPCRSDPALWFSEAPSDLELARVSCRRCPLRTECLAGAIERAEPWGVWGGEIFDAGTLIARKRPRGRPPRHLSDQVGPRPAPP
jgi:WhiB family transcriptional regulator, redox-sensing transcriptional regulator